MARHRDYKTSHNKRCPGQTPYTCARVETGTEHQADADSARDASMRTAAINATAANILEVPAPTEPQKTLQQQRQEWVDFLAEVAAEAAASQRNRQPNRRQERKKNQVKWSRVKYKTKKATKTQQNAKTSQPKISRRYVQDIAPSNLSATSTITAIPPPSYPRSEFEISIMPQIIGKGFDVQTPVDVDRLEFITKRHPNRAFVEYVVQGFRRGFRYGFQGDRQSLIQMNLPSIALNPAAFATSVQDE